MTRRYMLFDFLSINKLLIRELRISLTKTRELK